MNKEFFEDCFVFLAEFTNLNQIFSREKKEIEEYVRKATEINREGIYKKNRKEETEGIKNVFENLKNNCSPQVLDAIAELFIAWHNQLWDQKERCQQEITTYQGCLAQVEVAFLKGQIISMINPSGKLADFGKPAAINKD